MLDKIVSASLECKMMRSTASTSLVLLGIEYGCRRERIGEDEGGDIKHSEYVTTQTIIDMAVLDVVRIQQFLFAKWNKRFEATDYSSDKNSRISDRRWREKPF